MNIKKSILSFLISLTVITSTTTLAQDSTKIILLSERIGPIVDVEERNNYEILPNFKKNFMSAIYYLSDDSLFYCKVRLKAEDAYQDTIIRLSYNSTRNTAFRVQVKESKYSGKTSLNPDDIQLRYANDELVENTGKILEKNVLASGKNITQTNKEKTKWNIPLQKLLPIKRSGDNFSDLIKSKNKVGVSAGILFRNIISDRLNDIFNLLEENIPEHGYHIPISSLSFNSNPIFRFSTFFIITNNYLLEFEYLFNGQKNEREYFNYQAFSAMFGYLVPIKPTLLSYVTLAYSGVEFNAFNKYDIEVDDRQGFLEYIRLNGIANGIKLSCGLKYNFSSKVGIDFRAGYNYFPSLEIDVAGYDLYNKPVSVNINGLEFGLNLCFTNK